MAISLQEQWFYNLSLPFSYLFIDHESRNQCPEFYSGSITISEAFKGWNIHDRATLLETIGLMTDEHGHANVSNLPFAIYARGLPSEWQAYKSADKNTFLQFIDYMVESTGHLVQSGGIRAWDYSRMSYLARAGLATQLITHSEMLWIHYELGLRAQYFFTNWVQYFTSHFVGYHYWLMNDDGLETLLDWQTAYQQLRLTNDQEHFYQVLTDPYSQDLTWSQYLEPVEKPESMLEIDW